MLQCRSTRVGTAAADAIAAALTLRRAVNRHESERMPNGGLELVGS